MLPLVEAPEQILAALTQCLRGQPEFAMERIARQPIEDRRKGVIRERLVAVIDQSILVALAPPCRNCPAIRMKEAAADPQQLAVMPEIIIGPRSEPE